MQIVNGGMPAFLIGFGLAAIALYLTQRSFLVFLRGSLAQGKVVAITEKGFGVYASGCFFPVVEFVDGKGMRHQFQSKGGSRRPIPKVGEIVPVLYAPANPDNGFSRFLFGF